MVRLAKTLAEEAAWKLAKEKGIDLITTLPGVIVGPLLQPTLNFSSGVVASLINESPSASGRYALVESSAYFSEVVQMIHELYPTLPLANKLAAMHMIDSQIRLLRWLSTQVLIVNY
ncbi:hypothetical protein V2J09_000949 [Rumex salicifolius]